MLNKLYSYRFHTFLASQLTILFGALVFPQELFNTYIFPILSIGNLLAGLLLIYKKKKTFWFVGTLLLIATLVFAIEIIDEDTKRFFNILKLITYFVFHAIVTRELILQVWGTKTIDERKQS